MFGTDYCTVLKMLLPIEQQLVEGNGGRAGVWFVGVGSMFVNYSIIPLLARAHVRPVYSKHSAYV